MNWVLERAVTENALTWREARLRPMRGLRTERSASVVIRGHAFIQNLRRGHYVLAVDAGPLIRLATASNEHKPAI